MIKMTPEQHLAELLVHYINAKPNHVGGLCYWISSSIELIEEEEEEYIPDIFAIIPAVQQLRGCPRFAGGWYITNSSGFNERRRKLAKFILAKLESGELYYSPLWGGGSTRQNQPIEADSCRQSALTVMTVETPRGER